MVCSSCQKNCTNMQSTFIGNEYKKEINVFPDKLVCVGEVIDEQRDLQWNQRFIDLF